MKEIDIQRDILSYLSLKGYFAWRMPVGGVPQQNRGKMIFKKSPIKGFPDIMGVLKNCHGHLFGIEVKSSVGVLSKDQKIVRQKFIDAGCLFILARNLENVVDELKIHDINF
tara:strand:- start:4851 stop:5186 length:336 start_codon:yes stop_codon:yes gene_type:complete